MKIKNCLFFFMVFVLSSKEEIEANKAVDHAPIGVMGDHYHKKGEWMFSIRFSEMWMGDNVLDGNEISDSEIFIYL